MSKRLSWQEMLDYTLARRKEGASVLDIRYELESLTEGSMYVSLNEAHSLKLQTDKALEEWKKNNL